MGNDELETTKELENISDLNNQIIEMNHTKMDSSKEEISNEPNQNTFFTNPSKEKLKDKLVKWWKKRSKNQKVLIIGGIVLFFVLSGFGIFFLTRSLNRKEEPIPPVDVIVQEENYRYENGTLVFLNNNKEEIGRYTCENANEELCFVAYYSEEDQFDIEKKIYENTTYVKKRSSIINDTYVFVQDNPRKEDTTIKLYNMKENSALGLYTLVKKVDATKVILKNQASQYGVVEFQNDEMLTKLDFVYESLGYIENDKNVYITTQNGRNFITDEKGNNLSKAITGEIKNLNDKYVTVLLDDGKYEVHNYNNQNIFEGTYDYAALYEDYAILIQDMNMYLKFYDNNKLNEEAIQLKNKEYIKTNVYNENQQLVETKESFHIEENNNIISIIINNGIDQSTIMVNKAEGSLNKSLRNINYFDGKLYIYSDTSKTNLLGTYTCSNKNNISSGTKELTNCSLASDTVFEDNDYETPGKVGTIPVFNERFIFINDNPDLVNDSNKTIVLYDLKKNTSLGKYREINTYSYTGTDDITFSTVTDLQAVAKNQSGNFGVIKINLTEITGHINFNYSEMERLRDYYIVKDAHGYLLISQSNGSEQTSAVPYKIRDYNFNNNNKFIKAKMENGKYYVYDCKDKTCNQLTTEGFDYIELYDQYFAGVNNKNELGIFMYKNQKENMENIISGGTFILLNLKKYYGNGMLAFKISGNEILVGNENSYVPAAWQIEIPVEKEE